MGEAAKQSTNWTAIASCSACSWWPALWITKWAAAKTRSAADFYTGGGGITGFQNGLAIAGDHMSAASFLGISAAVMASGYDGLIYPSASWWAGLSSPFDGRAAAQPGQIHVCRRGWLSLSANAYPRLCRQWHAGGGGVLPDRPDGGRRPTPSNCCSAWTTGSPWCWWAADDGVCAFRRHDRPPPGCKSSKPACCWRA